jgi:hypothetical protein
MHFSTCYIYTVWNDTVPSRHPTLSPLLSPLQPQQVCTYQLVNVITINISVNILMVAVGQKYKDVCWKAKCNSPREMCSWFDHGTATALTTAHLVTFCCRHTNRETNKTQKGTKLTTQQCLHLPTENLHLFAKRFFGWQILNLFKAQISPQFSSSLRLINPSYIG